MNTFATPIITTLLLSFFSIPLFAKTEEQYFLGYSSGRADYTYDRLNTQDNILVNEFTIGRYVNKTLYTAASYVKADLDALENTGTTPKTTENNTISGIRFLIGKEIRLYPTYRLILDIGAIRWTEAATRTQALTGGEQTTKEIIKGYDLYFAIAASKAITDTASVNIKMEGFQTDNFGFRTLLLGIRFDL